MLFVSVVWYSTKQVSRPTRILFPFKSVIASTSHHSKLTYFHHLSLYEEEVKSGCILGLDSWADTGCSIKYAYVDYESHTWYFWICLVFVVPVVVVLWWETQKQVVVHMARNISWSWASVLLLHLNQYCRVYHSIISDTNIWAWNHLW